MPDLNVFQRMASKAGPPSGGQPPQAAAPAPSQDNVFYRMSTSQGGNAQPPATGDADTTADQPEGFWKSLYTSSPAQLAAHVVSHPVASASTAWDAARRLLTSNDEPASMSANPNPIIHSIGQAADYSRDNFQQGVDSFHRNGWTPDTRKSFGRSVPLLGQGFDKADRQHASGDNAGAVGTILGMGAGLVAPEAMKSVLPAAAEAPTRLKSWAFPKPVTATAAETSARGLAKALTVDPAGVNNFVKAAADEGPTVRAYADHIGIPLNSTLDFSRAAQGAADAVQSHYDGILQPHVDARVNVPENYQGGLRGTATVGDVNSRVNAINVELRSNFRKPLQGQTAAANVSDADLIAEKQGLSRALHDEVGRRSGMDPADLDAIYRKAGKLRTIADEAQASANRNTTAAGRVEMGQGATPTSKAGVFEWGLQKVRGGPEIQGNRMVRGAAAQIPANPEALSLPKPSGVVSEPVDVGARKLQAHLQQSTGSGLTPADVTHLSGSVEGRSFLNRAWQMVPGSKQMRALTRDIVDSGVLSRGRTAPAVAVPQRTPTAPSAPSTYMEIYGKP